MPIPNFPPVLPMPIANSGDVNDIPVTTPTGTGQLSFQAGFPFITQVPLLAGGIAPSRPDMNAALRLLSQHAFFAQSGGVYPWQGADGDFAGLNYLAGWHVMGADGNEYTAKLPNGPDVPATGGGFVGPKDPTIEPDYWSVNSQYDKNAISGVSPIVVTGDLASGVSISFNALEAEQLICTMNKTGSQALGPATNTRITLTGEVTGEASWANTSTSRITVPVDGTYVVVGWWLGSGPNNAGLNYDTYLNLNGVSGGVGRQSGVMMGSSYAFNNIAVIKLTAGDYIDFSIVTNSSSPTLTITRAFLSVFKA